MRETRALALKFSVAPWSKRAISARLVSLSEELKAAFETHTEETEEQIERLEKVFEIFDMEPRGKKCAGMQGLVKEGSEKLRRKLAMQR